MFIHVGIVNLLLTVREKLLQQGLILLLNLHETLVQIVGGFDQGAQHLLLLLELFVDVLLLRGIVLIADYLTLSENVFRANVQIVEAARVVSGIHGAISQILPHVVNLRH